MEKNSAINLYMHRTMDTMMTEIDKVTIAVSGFATMSEQNTGAWKVSGKDFNERNSKAKLTREQVTQLTRETAFNFEVATYKHVETLSKEDREKMKAIVARMRKFGFQNLQLLDHQEKIREELAMMRTFEISEAEAEIKENEKELEEKLKKQKIVSRIIDVVFQELKTFLMESFKEGE
jgi:L-2-hydroxyglutarate oxidase LhgO